MRPRWHAKDRKEADEFAASQSNTRLDVFPELQVASFEVTGGIS